MTAFQLAIGPKGLDCRGVDPETFTTPWTGVVTYRKNIGPWPERICAESLTNYGIIDDPDLPKQDVPDV